MQLDWSQTLLLHSNSPKASGLKNIGLFAQLYGQTIHCITSAILLITRDCTLQISAPSTVMLEQHRRRLRCKMWVWLAPKDSRPDIPAAIACLKQLPVPLSGPGSMHDVCIVKPPSAQHAGLPLQGQRFAAGSSFLSLPDHSAAASMIRNETTHLCALLHRRHVATRTARRSASGWAGRLRRCHTSATGRCYVAAAAAAATFQ